MKTITKIRAKELGLRHFYTGRPCKYGHFAARLVSCGNCTGCFVEYERKRYAANPEKILAKNRRWRVKHPEKINEISRNWCAANRKTARAIKQKYASKPEVKAQRKIWFKEYRQRPESKILSRQHKRTRRALETGADGSHTPKDVANIFKMQRGKCAYCRVKLANEYHVDHIVPLSAGGSNDRKNLQILCPPCNLHKHAKDPIEFSQSLGLLV